MNDRTGSPQGAATGLGWPDDGAGPGTGTSAGTASDPRRLSTGLGWPGERVSPQEEPVSPQVDPSASGTHEAPAPAEPGDVSRETAAVGHRVAGPDRGGPERAGPALRRRDHPAGPGRGALGAGPDGLAAAGRDAPSGGHPGGGGRQPEGRGGQDDHHRQHGRGAWRSSASGCWSSTWTPRATPPPHSAPSTTAACPRRTRRSSTAPRCPTSPGPPRTSSTSGWSPPPSTWPAPRSSWSAWWPARTG